MIPGIGTIINSLAVIGVGIVTRIFVKKEIKNFENNLLPLGLLVLTLGIRESLKSPEFLLTLIAVLIGAIIGTYLKIEERIKNFGEYLHNKFEKESSEKNKFIESYLTASLIVITGPLAIVGPFLDVVEGNIELLLIKTALDCFLVLFLTSSGGKGAVYSGSVENFSQHPIAKSIVYQSEIREITLLSAQDVKEQSGVGIEGVVEGQHIKIQNNVASKESSLKVTINEKVYIIYLEEESSVSTNFLNELKLEKEIIILSGDKEINVKKFADNHNVDEYHFGKNPEEKLEFIKNKQERNQVIFIGDGINDSPSIKQADVGVTTSSSSQIAQVAGDILIHKGGLETLNKIFKLSKKSKLRIYQNLFLAFIYNNNLSFIFLSITSSDASLALYPILFTDFIISSKLLLSSATSTIADFRGKLTDASRTFSFLERMRSIRAAQAAQVIPSMSKLIDLV